MVWTIKQFLGQKEITLKATFSLPSIASRNIDSFYYFILTNYLADRDNFQKVPINIIFEIPYFTVSGINVIPFNKINPKIDFE